MPGTTSISWVARRSGQDRDEGHVWNPVVGCTRVSEACRHCYAEALHDLRHAAFQAGKLQNVPQYARPFSEVQLLPDRLTVPLRWRAATTVFVNSMSDLFHPAVPDRFIWQVLATIAATPRHTYLVLTKRPERARDLLRAPGAIEALEHAVRDLTGKMGWDRAPTWAWPLDNLWMGTSVEDQRSAQARLPALLATPAASRFLSAEPLLGELDLWPWIAPGPEQAEWNLARYGHSRPLQLVIAGGESGAGARPMHPDWARRLRDDCRAARMRFHFKQWGAWAPEDHLTDGTPAAEDRWLPSGGDKAPVRMRRCTHGRGWPGRQLDGEEHDPLPTDRP